MTEKHKNLEVRRDSYAKNLRTERRDRERKNRVE